MHVNAMQNTQQHTAVIPLNNLTETEINCHYKCLHGSTVTMVDRVKP